MQGVAPHGCGQLAHGLEEAAHQHVHAQDAGAACGACGVQRVVSPSAVRLEVNRFPNTHTRMHRTHGHSTTCRCRHHYGTASSLHQLPLQMPSAPPPPPRPPMQRTGNAHEVVRHHGRDGHHEALHNRQRHVQVDEEVGEAVARVVQAWRWVLRFWV